MFKILATVLFVSVLASSAGANEDAKAVLKVKHAYNESGDAVYVKRTEYFLEILNLALTKAGREYILVPVPTKLITGSRNTRYLNSGHYDVAWMHTNLMREKHLLPVRLPLNKGLIGWRVMFIPEGTQEKFKNITSENQLKPLVVGLGHDWPDTFVMRENGFNVSTATSRESMLNMLRRHRVDYYSRSILEIWSEQTKNDMKGIEIEQSLLLHYPSAIYFFLPKNKSELAEVIRVGLEMSIKDGSFDEVFWKYYREYIAQAKLSERTFLSIPNAFLSKETPLDRKELWLSVTDIKAFEKQQSLGQH